MGNITALGGGAGNVAQPNPIFDGGNVPHPIQQGGADQNANQVAEQSRNRVCGFFAEAGKRVGAAIALPVVASVGLAALTVGAALSLPAYAMAKVADGVRYYLSGSNQPLADALNLAEINDSIISQQIETASGDKNVGEVLNEYLTAINSPLDPEEMQNYVKMGGLIVNTINGMDNYTGGPIEVDGVEVKPSLETARAVSWFLQAKALTDNAGGDREPMLLNRGSMVLEDPGNKLGNFLKSAPNTYGRASTHFNERSGIIAGFMNAGFAGTLINLKNTVTGSESQGAQMGIEDFSNKLPSGKGCLLFSSLTGREFDRTEGPDAEPQQQQEQLFLKWESAGMPNVLHPKATHYDSEAGYGAKVWGRVMAFGRCLQHTFNFLSGTHQSDWGIHREAVHKGGPEPLYQEFKTQMQGIETAENLQDGWASRMTADAKKFGLDFMASVLAQYSNNAEAAGLLERIDQHIDEQGPNLGILARRGDEIHLSLT